MSFQFLTLQGSHHCTVSWWIIYSARADVIVAEHLKLHSCELGFQVKWIPSKSTKGNCWQKSPFEQVGDAVRNLWWLTFFRKMSGNHFIEAGCVSSDESFIYFLILPLNIQSFLAHALTLTRAYSIVLLPGPVSAPCSVICMLHDCIQLFCVSL